MVSFDRGLLKIFPFLDRRSGLYKCVEVIVWLYENGYEDHNSVIDIDVLEEAIGIVCGFDSRTMRKYLNMLVKLHFLIPHSNRKVSDVKRVTIRTTRSIIPRDYCVEKGFASYKYGLEAIRIIDEIQKQRKLLVSPAPPSRSFCEGKVAEKYVCACSTPSEENLSYKHVEKNAENICVHREERRRSCAPHTHIYLNKEKKNLTNAK